MQQMRGAKGGMNIVAGMVLTMLTYTDIRKRRIPILPVLGMGAVLFALHVVAEKNVFKILCGMIPGMLLLLFSLLSKEKIGMGDAVLLVCLGMGYSFEQVLSMFFCALVLAAVVSGVLLSLKKVGRKTEIPFVPFLLLGWLLTLLGG